MTDGNDKKQSSLEIIELPSPVPGKLTKDHIKPNVKVGDVVSNSASHISNSVNSKGNVDAQILAKAFEEYAADGLTAEERVKIEKLDDILKGADIVISKDGTFATIAQEDGQTFKVTPKGRGR